ncbi:MAG: FdhF/YdeP family oxidoreductase [Lewinellaceae bacterium]|nr:FdhF/YdeP family oxidoreductase [Lewinellaceae bacterium]
MEEKNTPQREDKGHQIVVVNENTGAQPPEKFTGLKRKKPKENSAGLPAVATALGHANRYLNKGDAAKLMFRINQKGGFDCPGCAWPDPDDDRSRLGEYCENGIKAISEEAQNKTIGADFFARHTVAEMRGWSDFELGKQGRLAEPLVLRPGAEHYTPISWEDAFALIGKELQALPSPDEAVFYTSGRTSNEAAFMYQLFVREYGTNNLPDCSNMCHESSGVALTETLGIGKGSVTLADLHQAELIIIMGQNPGTNHPRMLNALEKCKANGGKIISINPLPEAGLVKFTNPQKPGKLLKGGTALTDLFLPVKINGDVALLKAIMSLLLYQEKSKPGTAFDMEFITEKTAGYEAFVSDLQRYDFNTLTEAAGVPRALIKQAAEIIRKAEKIIVCWAMGLTQHENGVENIREIVNLLLLKGAIGKPGAGTCPVRGHSNVQGDRTMGIWEAPKAEFLNKLEETFGFAPPRHHGYATVDAIQAMHQGKAKVFIGMGGNFLSATPDTEYTAEALRRCRLTVQVSTKLNRSHLIHGQQALILPCLGRTDRDIQESGEQFVSTENSMGVVQLSKGVLRPPSKHLRSEPAIVAGMAQATLGSRSRIDWAAWTRNYDLVRDAIEQVIPGFSAYNERVRQPGGFYLPNSAREQEFTTPGQRALFTVNPAPQWNLKPGEFLMMTIRSHDQFNTTIYGLDDRYRGIYQERRVVLMNAEDMKASGLKEQQVVDLHSEYQGTQRTARQFMVISYPIPRQCVATYFPEANVLIPVDAYAPKSKTPISKSVIIRVTPAEVTTP